MRLSVHAVCMLNSVCVCMCVHACVHVCVCVCMSVSWERDWLKVRDKSVGGGVGLLVVWLYTVGQVCAHIMCMCIETDRFKPCALVGDTVDHASLGGGSSECYWWARRQLDIGCLLSIQSGWQCLSRLRLWQSLLAVLFLHRFYYPQSDIKGGQADCSRWVTIRRTPIALYVNMHVVLHVYVYVHVT